MSAKYEVRGNVAVITLDNPPVNGLGHDTRKGITDGLDRAQRLPATGTGEQQARRFPAAPTSASSAVRRRWPSRTC